MVLLHCRSVFGKGNEWVGSTDEETDWREGWGWLARFRTIGSVSGLDLASVAAFAKKVGWYAAATAGTALTSIVVALIVFRFVRKRTLLTRSRFHRFCHWLRDESRNIQLAAESGRIDTYSSSLERFHSRAANLVASYFRAIAGDKTVNCAIRICLEDRNDPSGYAYTTLGRSDEMNSERETLSVPLSSQQGIALKLRNQNQLGVVIVRSIPAAVAEGWWKSCPTDQLADVTTCMVAPINSRTSQGVRSMLGILYVTSRHDCFRRRHVEPMKGIADLLGMTYPSLALAPTDGSERRRP
jgi:hypothetical protein